MGKFGIGKLYMTRGVYEKVKTDLDFQNFVDSSFARFVSCDWGDMCNEDKILNDDAVKYNDGRIHGAYLSEKLNIKIWIITEADRSATTILFPSEY